MSNPITACPRCGAASEDEAQAKCMPGVDECPMCDKDTFAESLAYLNQMAEWTPPTASHAWPSEPTEYYFEGEEDGHEFILKSAFDAWRAAYKAEIARVEGERDALGAENLRLIVNSQAAEQRATENERDRQRVNKVMCLAAHDVLFFGDGFLYNPNARSFEIPPRYMLICNDTFGYACADCQDVSDAQIDEVFDLYQRFGSDGAIAWIAHQRGIEPLKQVRTEEYKQARAALASGESTGERK